MVLTDIPPSFTYFPPFPAFLLWPGLLLVR